MELYAFGSILYHFRRNDIPILHLIRKAIYSLLPLLPGNLTLL